jgi:hypothetical protein
MRLDAAKTPDDLRAMYAERGRKISERITEKEARGEVMRAVPLGYRAVPGADGKTRAVPDPSMWPLLQEARSLFESGTYTIRRLAEEMEAKGLRSRSGKRVGPSALWYAIKRSPVEPDADVVQSQLYTVRQELDGT